jgi:hypothetical protein
MPHPMLAQAPPDGRPHARARIRTRVATVASGAEPAAASLISIADCITACAHHARPLMRCMRARFCRASYLSKAASMPRSTASNGNSSLAPGLDQRPIQRGKQQNRPAPLLEALLDLGKIIKVVTHVASPIRLKFRSRRTENNDVNGWICRARHHGPSHAQEPFESGHTVVAYSRTGAKLDAVVADGAQRAASNADVGRARFHRHHHAARRARSRRSGARARRNPLRRESPARSLST